MLKALWKSGRKAMQVLETMRNVSEYTFLISGLRLTITDDVNLTGKTVRSSPGFCSLLARESTMKNNSERLVVFVTPALKRAIAATARELDISVSELLRRAVLAFDETANPVRAARIVDNWHTRQAPNALDEILRRIDATPIHSDSAQPVLPPPAQRVSTIDADDAEALESCRSECDADVSPQIADAKSEPVACAVAHALALHHEDAGAREESGRTVIDAQTVARMAARWLTVVRTRDADTAAAFDPVETVLATRWARTGS
jgi:hypothetical protein